MPVVLERNSKCGFGTPKGGLFGALVFVAILGSAIASTPAFGAEIQVQTPFDDAWRRANQALALQNITITSSDKSSGVIQGSASFAGNREWFTCSRGRGILDKEEFTVTVVVSGDTTGRATVRVQAAGRTTWYQHHRIVVVTFGHVYNYGTCQSTGTLESLIVARVAGGPAA